MSTKSFRKESTSREELGKRPKREKIKATIPSKEHLPVSFQVHHARETVQAGKRFDANLYNDDDAKELLEYTTYFRANPRANTPESMKRRKADPNGMFSAQGSGKPNLSPNTLEDDLHAAAVRRHRAKVHAHLGSGQLGSGGDFSEVRYSLPEERFIETNVHGLASGRLIEAKETEKLVRELYRDPLNCIMILAEP